MAKDVRRQKRLNIFSPKNAPLIGGDTRQVLTKTSRHSHSCVSYGEDSHPENKAQTLISITETACTEEAV